MTSYYRLHPHKDDSGYLQALVEECRQLSRRLPTYSIIQPLVLRAAHLAQVLPLNHELSPTQRDTQLEHWATQHRTDAHGLAWFERTAAASAWLTILALLALACEPNGDVAHAQAIYGAYLPWICLTGTMLDSYSDLAEDTTSGAHSYLAHYPTTALATKRISELLRHSTAAAQKLPAGGKHSVIVACMTAMYLTKNGAHKTHLRTHTRALARSGGPLTSLLLPVLRLWRIVYQLRST